MEAPLFGMSMPLGVLPYLCEHYWTLLSISSQNTTGSHRNTYSMCHWKSCIPYKN